MVKKIGDREISAVIGSRFGGFLADQSVPLVCFSAQCLSCSRPHTAIHHLWFVNGLYHIAHNLDDCCMVGAVQNYNVVSLPPEAPGIMASLNSSFTQLGIAEGAGIGGLPQGDH